jgi:PqqD family protein of HPr-rel-A system
VRSYTRAPGVLFAPLGEGWAAFSTLSGETHLLNSESVAVVESLDLHEPRTERQVAESLADDSGMTVQELLQTLAPAWPMLLEAGLVREQGAAACSPV